MHKHDRNLPPALILSADTNGLGAVRSLYLAKVPTIAFALSPEQPVMRSRLPRRKILVNGEGDELLLAALKPFEGCSAVLIPTSDRFVSFILRNRSYLQEKFRFCVPPNELTNALLDKVLETELIERSGVELPRTVRTFPEKSQELADALGLPIIIKPRDSDQVRYLRRKNFIARTENDLADFYEKHAGQLWRFLAQEVIPGDDDTLWVCNCVFNEQYDLATAHVFRRLRTSPAHYGVTSYARSECEKAVLDRVARLGRYLRYMGPAMVEFKFDSRDNSYRYLEINPRLGLCNYFGTVCGMNTALSTYLLASGQHVPPMNNKQRDDVMYLSFYEDTYSRLKDRESPWAICMDYLKGALRPHVFAHFTTYDLAPWLAETHRQLSQLMHSVFKRFIPGRKTKK